MRLYLVKPFVDFYGTRLNSIEECFDEERVQSTYDSSNVFVFGINPDSRDSDIATNRRPDGKQGY